ncbi:MAG: hypothetical protein HZB62_11955 [Nitrospirae bacterium]|nr:hypothetical protein [Nitrospirota bacterium]
MKIAVSQLRDEVNVEEAGRQEKPPVGTGYSGITIPKGVNRKLLIKNMIAHFVANNDLADFTAPDFGLSEEQRSSLKELLLESRNRTVEDMLRKGTFTFWQKGTKFMVFRRLSDDHISSNPLDGVVVKAALPGTDLKKALKGYGNAKQYLGKALSVATSLCNIDLNIRDAEGVERRVSLTDVLVQERVIVIGEIAKMVREKTLEFRERDKLQGISARKTEKDPLIAKLTSEYKQISQLWTGLCDTMEKKNLRDTDEFRQPAAMERNFGIEVPPGMTLPDWGYEGFREVKKRIKRKAEAIQNEVEKRKKEAGFFRKLFDKKKMQEIEKETAIHLGREYLRVKGFDFDSLVVVNQSLEMKKDRVPDVFEKEVLKSFSHLLDTVIVQEA